MPKVKQFFLHVLMIIRLKHFHNSLNIALILPAVREFFSPKCAQFPLTFTE